MDYKVRPSPCPLPMLIKALILKRDNLFTLDNCRGDCNALKSVEYDMGTAAWAHVKDNYMLEPLILNSVSWHRRIWILGFF